MRASRVLSGALKTVSSQEAVAMLRETGSSAPKISVVDVRSPDEYVRDGRLNCSINVPLACVQAGAGALPNALHGKCLFVCKSGMRSRMAAEQIAQSCPNLEVYTLEGGLSSASSNPELQNLLHLPGAGQVKVWSMERQVRFTAGSMVALGVTLGTLVGPAWMILPAFVGCGLMFSAATDTCTMAKVLAYLPWNRS